MLFFCDMQETINFVAIDFETSNRLRSSVCEAGICVVRQGKVIETKSWFVKPENNYYEYWNIKVHGITPDMTENAPEFPLVWSQILQYLKDYPILVAHNAAFDMSCIRALIEKYQLPKSKIDYYCSCRYAKKIYDFPKSSLDFLCETFEIPYGMHHRAGDDAQMCANLFLRELRDDGWKELEEIPWLKKEL